MSTFLPQNQFILNPSVTPEPPTEGPAVASSDLQPRATAESIIEPSMTNGGDPGAPASAPTKNPDVGVLADRIDWHAFFKAVMDERVVLFELYDEVPLFLRNGDHLKRWNA